MPMLNLYKPHIFKKVWGFVVSKNQNRNILGTFLTLKYKNTPLKQYRKGYSTQSRGRTGTTLRSLVFETSASTDSAIWANCRQTLIYVNEATKVCKLLKTAKQNHKLAFAQAVISSLLSEFHAFL